jgi:hypothetical protein
LPALKTHPRRQLLLGYISNSQFPSQQLSVPTQVCLFDLIDVCVEDHAAMCIAIRRRMDAAESISIGSRKLIIRGAWPPGAEEEIEIRPNPRLTACCHVTHPARLK